MSETVLDANSRSSRSSRRRLLVALALLGCAVVYASGTAAGHAASLSAIAGGLLWILAYFLLRREVQEAADLPDDRLDEREIFLRDRSHLGAHRLLGAALAASLLLALVDDAVDSRLVESWLNPLAALLLLSAVLPSIVLAVTATSTDDAGEQRSPAG